MQYDVRFTSSQETNSYEVNHDCEQTFQLKTPILFRRKQVQWFEISNPTQLYFLHKLQCMKTYIELLVQDGIVLSLTCPDADCEHSGKISELEVSINHWLTVFSTSNTSGIVNNRGRTDKPHPFQGGVQT